MNEEKDTKSQLESSSAEEKTERRCAFPCHHSSARLVLALLVFLAALCLAFAAGRVSIKGARKIGGNYQVYRGDMMGSRDGRGGMMGRGEKAGSILSGKITAVNGTALTVNSDNKDYTVNILDSTSISKDGAIAKTTDIAVSNTVRVRGASKSDGSIDAILISIQTN